MCEEVTIWQLVKTTLTVSDHTGYALDVPLGACIKDAKKARASELYSMRFGAKGDSGGKYI